MEVDVETKLEDEKMGVHSKRKTKRELEAEVTAELVQTPAVDKASFKLDDVHDIDLDRKKK